MTRRVKAAAAIVVGMSLSAVLPSGEVGAAPGGECDIPNGSDFCVDDGSEVPGQPAAPAAHPEGRSSEGGGDRGPRCTWRQDGVVGPAGGVDGGPFLEVAGTKSPGAELQAEVCDGVYTGRVRGVPAGTPAPAPALPAPELLASIVRVRLEGSLPEPTVASTPAPGVAALVGYPSFVSVTNWTGVVTEGECDPTGLLCVTVTATPALRFSPGEPDSPVLECAGPGVPFDPAGDPFEQAAAAEACAHPYRLRTGVDGRPGEWPGEVTVVWELAWSSTSGARGPLAPVEKSAPVPRAVNEVQTVVVSAGE
jgi:hypothetical protein